MGNVWDVVYGIRGGDGADMTVRLRGCFEKVWKWHHMEHDGDCSKVMRLTGGDENEEGREDVGIGSGDELGEVGGRVGCSILGEDGLIMNGSCWWMLWEMVPGKGCSMTLLEVNYRGFKE